MGKSQEGSVGRGQTAVIDGNQGEIQEDREKNNENGTVEHQKWTRGQGRGGDIVFLGFFFLRSETKGDGEEY